MEDPDVMRRVSWRDLFPWLLITRVFSLSVSLPVLFLATIGVLLMPLGWWLAGWLLIPQSQWDADPQLRQVAYYHNAWIWDRGREPLVTFANADRQLLRTLYAPENYFTSLTRLDLTWNKLAYLALGGLWTLLIWAFLAGAITRLAAVHLGREERLGLREAVRHAARHLGSYLLAPISPLLLSLILGLAILICFGLPMRLDVGVLVMGCLWVIALLGGFMIAVLLLGLVIGWPLMWVTISAQERGDAFEAWSRSYSYCFQRPLHYLCYAIMVLLFWLLCWALVYWFSEAIITLSYAAARLGMGPEQASELYQAWIGVDRRVSWSMWIGSNAMAFWIGLVRCIAAAFNYGFFFCAATAIYLLLRRDADQTGLDEVFMEDEEERYGLGALLREKSEE